MAWTICLSDADISSVTTAYTVAAGTEARLTASFTNRSTSAIATVTLWVVPQGESRGNEHLKESGTTLGLAGTSQAVLERSFVAPAGCVVYVQASTANVSCQVQGDVVAIDTTSNVEDGTSLITYGTNWSNASSQTKLKRSFASIVTLNLAVLASGTPGIPIATLPSGYRPASTMDAVAGILYDSSAAIYIPAYFLIQTSGAIYVSGLTGTSMVSAASGDIAFLNATYFNT